MTEHVIGMSFFQIRMVDFGLRLGGTAPASHSHGSVKLLTVEEDLEHPEYWLGNKALEDQISGQELDVANVKVPSG